MKNNGLNTYDEPLIPKEHQKIFKYAFIILAIIALIILIISIFYNDLFDFLLTFVIGGIVSILLFYITHKIIGSSYYLQYKKAIKRIHIIHQITYVVIFTFIAVFLRSIYSIVGITLGLLLIKIASFFYSLKEKNKR